MQPRLDELKQAFPFTLIRTIGVGAPEQHLKSPVGFQARKPVKQWLQPLEFDVQNEQVVNGYDPRVILVITGFGEEPLQR